MLARTKDKGSAAPLFAKHASVSAGLFLTLRD